MIRLAADQPGNANCSAAEQKQQNVKVGSAKT